MAEAVAADDAVGADLDRDGGEARHGGRGKARALQLLGYRSAATSARSSRRHEQDRIHVLAAEVGRDLAGVRRHLAEDAVVAARHIVGVEDAAELTAPHELAHGV